MDPAACSLRRPLYPKRRRTKERPMSSCLYFTFLKLFSGQQLRRKKGGDDLDERICFEQCFSYDVTWEERGRNSKPCEMFHSLHPRIAKKNPLTVEKQMYVGLWKYGDYTLWKYRHCAMEQLVQEVRRQICIYRWSKRSNDLTMSHFSCGRALEGGGGCDCNKRTMVGSCRYGTSRWTRQFAYEGSGKLKKKDIGELLYLTPPFPPLWMHAVVMYGTIKNTRRSCPFWVFVAY